MECPKCKSSNIQRFQVIHEQGTSNININSNTVGGGVAFGGGLRGGLGLGKTGSLGTTQTLLAKKTQPPKDERFSLCIGIIIITLILYFAVKTEIIFIIWCIIGLILCFYSIKKGAEIYNSKYSEWLNKWYCNKCGNIFIGK
jgi:hypothetical protein